MFQFVLFDLFNKISNFKGEIADEFMYGSWTETTLQCKCITFWTNTLIHGPLWMQVCWIIGTWWVCSRTTEAQWSLFLYQNPKLLGLGRQFGQTNFGAFGEFLVNLSTPILIKWVSCLPLINHYSYKKLSLYIQIPNIYLGLEFEFGQQRIRDLAIVCP